MTALPRAFAGVLVAAAVALPAVAQSGRAVLFDEVAAPATIQVSSPAIGANGTIAAQYSGYGRNIPPAVAWTPGPPGTRSYALVVQDPDSATPKPTLHWVAYDIPAATLTLSRKTPNEPRLEDPAGMKQGPNDHGGVGYTGPHPPVGDPPHHYHVQVFALDRKTLKLRPGSTLDQVSLAMQGRVLAKGETIGLFAHAPPTPPKG